MSGGLLVGVDTGGTFTDVVGFDPERGEVRSLKVSSTPDDPERAVLQGLKSLLELMGARAAAVAGLTHGTTVATNAILEGKWARTALITTRGFRDVVEIGRQDRPELYRFRTQRPRPLVPRDLRFELPERLDARGQVLLPLDRAALEAVATTLQGLEVESVAVVFLFSYLNPAHEQQALEVLAQKLAVPVALSSVTWPEFREYERTSTTVLNAALIPRVRRYLRALQAETAALGIEKTWRVMQSNGGLTHATHAAELPVTLLLSGPAGGVEGARFVGRQMGFENVIAVDMGGTSCDVSLIVQGQARWTMRGQIGGRPLGVPMVDIRTLGAGGGSVGWIDQGGALRVGPQSAGAEPGPACYGRGGSEPTVTDAQLVLGRLDPGQPLGDIPRLELEAARRAIETRLARPLGCKLEEAAAGLLTVANAHMEQALRLISVERGFDPRRFALLAFGGAGPLHAGELARRLGISTVLIPQAAGVLSAFGLLSADGVHHFVQTVLEPLPSLGVERVNAAFQRFEARARARLEAEGFEGEEVALFPSADLRYRGQSHPLNVEVGSVPLEGGLEALRRRFFRAHRRVYGTAPEEEVELVNLRLRAVGRTAKPELPRRSTALTSVEPYQVRPVFFPGAGWVDCPCYEREGVSYPLKLKGPAVVSGVESTVVVRPEQELSTHPQGHLVLRAAPGGRDP